MASTPELQAKLKLQQLAAKKSSADLKARLDLLQLQAAQQQTAQSGSQTDELQKQIILAQLAETVEAQQQEGSEGREKRKPIPLPQVQRTTADQTTVNRQPDLAELINLEQGAQGGAAVQGGLKNLGNQGQGAGGQTQGGFPVPQQTRSTTAQTGARQVAPGVFQDATNFSQTVRDNALTPAQALGDRRALEKQRQTISDKDSKDLGLIMFAEEQGTVDPGSTMEALRNLQRIHGPELAREIALRAGGQKNIARAEFNSALSLGAPEYIKLLNEYERAVKTGDPKRISRMEAILNKRTESLQNSLSFGLDANGMPTLTVGPRGIKPSQARQENQSLESFTQKQRTLFSLRTLIQTAKTEPTLFGTAGKIRSGVSSVVGSFMDIGELLATPGAVGLLGDTKALTARLQARNLADPGVFDWLVDPDIDQVRSLGRALAIQMAVSNTPGSRLSIKMVERQEEILGLNRLGRNVNIIPVLRNIATQIENDQLDTIRFTKGQNPGLAAEFERRMGPQRKFDDEGGTQEPVPSAPDFRFTLPDGTIARPKGQ